jgi:hypothetical protein
MRITLNELRRIIREALAEGMEFEQAEELHSEPKPRKLNFKQAQDRYAELIMGAMRDTMRDNPGNVSAMQAAMRAISDEVLKQHTGWSVKEIQARTEQETRAAIADMKLQQGRR